MIAEIASAFVGFIAGVWAMMLLTPSRITPDLSSLVDEFGKRAKASATEAATQKEPTP